VNYADRDLELESRIDWGPSGGTLTIRDTGISYFEIIERLQAGMTKQEVLAAMPVLERDDIEAALYVFAGLLFRPRDADGRPLPRGCGNTMQWEDLGK
jgi:uncharacterized protein (DUF433 family)